jgi:hypothetical protein
MRLLSIHEQQRCERYVARPLLVHLERAVRAPASTRKR